MEELHIFIFYMVIVVMLSSVTYYMVNEQDRMMYSLISAIVGVVISMALWKKYGQYSVISV